ncbi:Asp23/Gls24 family envelope stress response protein [Nocardia transvalensis]|uniref:Asp23/Gls24 family envelope stress response protein n=1 Tax=Nocardia transvalensis TaxID=37333 RepID=UPI001895862F|nr:Asp23/Gls24 family envelope stress response protein [Nocardia transvalensis]MBF6326916.1 Asp23/Gls24 family envelope stress response protein [Nocardia transvalensis]
MTAVAPQIEYVVADAVIAGVAARAAAAVPGVLRLEPGVLGLVGHLARSGRQLWTGQESAPSPGVRVRRAGGWLNIQVDLAMSAGARIGEVGQAVQQRVARAVTEQTGVEVDAVAVAVLDIEPGES